MPDAGEPARGERLWLVLAALTALWELQAFVQHPRRDHPTLSSLSNDLFRSPSSRAVAFLLWLALGVWLARR